MPQESTKEYNICLSMGHDAHPTLNLEGWYKVRAKNKAAAYLIAAKKYLHDLDNRYDEKDGRPLSLSRLQSIYKRKGLIYQPYAYFA